MNRGLGLSKRSQTITVAGFLLPAMFIYVLFLLIPTLGTLWFSFFRMDGFGTKEWVGLQNYIDAFTKDRIFWRAFFNNVIYLFATLVLEVGTGLVLAIMLNYKLRGSSLFRILFFTPMVLSMVVVGIMWQFILHPADGLLNRSLIALGLGSLAQPWLANPWTALPAICVVSGWIFAGFFMVLFYAALQRIPASLIESARIDGASEWQIIWNVVLPLMREVILVAVLICATGAFKAFDLVFVMTNGQPFHTTEMIATWMVKEAFNRFHLGYGSALNIIMTIIVLAISALFLWFQRRRQVLEY